MEKAFGRREGGLSELGLAELHDVVEHMCLGVGGDKRMCAVVVHGWSNVEAILAAVIS